ncbi:hypothetical protein [Amycolatopsis thailandensis]|uniref:hypothetical protein n=1 Tax=Amycolatopsis thailandensis TaxID=589330 RepID=UPI00363FC85F
MRSLADVAGVSVRMLCYYFGTRERLLSAVLMYHRKHNLLSAVAEAESRREALLTSWAYYQRPAQEPLTRLFFHLAGEGMHSANADPAISGAISSWVDLFRDLGVREGLPRDQAAQEAHLITTAFRGLLLDRLLTQDVEAADRGFDVLLDKILPVTKESRR